MNTLTIIIIIMCLAYVVVDYYQYNKMLDKLIGTNSSDERLMEATTIVDVRSFDINFLAKIRRAINKSVTIFRPNITLKLSLFFLISFVSLYFINDLFLRVTYWKLLIFCEPILLFLFYFSLKKRKEARFKENFSDALNILSSAMSSGQSIVHAFDFVGKQMDNEVGHEFEHMAKRLLIGEDPNDVLERSSIRFPYLEYFFFISAIRINMKQGGQLKDVITRINRLIFVSKNIDKKKNSLTSEARMSAKIVGFLPVFFLLILYFVNIENYNFVMFEEAGRPIFYYVLISELIGFFIIWLILKGVD